MLVVRLKILRLLDNLFHSQGVTLSYPLSFAQTFSVVVIMWFLTFLFPAYY